MNGIAKLVLILGDELLQRLQLQSTMFDLCRLSAAEIRSLTGHYLKSMQKWNVWLIPKQLKNVDFYPLSNGLCIVCHGQHSAYTPEPTNISIFTNQ